MSPTKHHNNYPSTIKDNSGVYAFCVLRWFNQTRKLDPVHTGVRRGAIHLDIGLMGINIPWTMLRDFRSLNFGDFDECT